MEMAKRRQRIVRIFMVVGTVALGIGLLLLLWIGLMLEGKQPKKNGGTTMRPMEAEEGEKEIVPTNVTMDSVQKVKVQTNESDAILRLPNSLLRENANASSGKEGKSFGLKAKTLIIVLGVIFVMPFLHWGLITHLGPNVALL
jgi:flagellar basal body-associated protein FliL